MDEIVSSLLSELNLDSTDENTTLITSLVNDANDLTLSAIDSNVSFEIYSQNLTYIRAIKTLATQMFYDRTLENGAAMGYRMMLTKLQGQQAEGDDSQ